MAESQQAAQPARRDFIVQAAQAFVGVGCAAALWPFIAQMNPNNGTPPPEVKEVDLSSIRPSENMTVQWRNTPILIRHRTPEEVRMARSARASELPDRFARSQALPKAAPANDDNRTKHGHESWLVVVGVCTHMGCLLKSNEAGAARAMGEGWVCPCHAARTNLPVPHYTFASATRIRIG
jgi:ubiquinol-cytochrome c reductase iron-sulfur subunit